MVSEDQQLANVHVRTALLHQVRLAELKQKKEEVSACRVVMGVYTLTG